MESRDPNLTISSSYHYSNPHQAAPLHHQQQQQTSLYQFPNPNPNPNPSALPSAAAAVLRPPGVAEPCSQDPYGGAQPIQTPAMADYYYYYYQQQQQTQRAGPSFFSYATVGAGATAAEVEVKRQKVLECGAPPESVRTCMICNVVCNSDKVFALHLAGEKHAQKAFGIPPNASKPKGPVRRKSLQLTKKAGRPTPKSVTQASTGLISFVSSLHCEVCKIDCNNPRMLNTHRQGKKHIRNLQKLQESVKPNLANVFAKKSNPKINLSATRNKEANEQVMQNPITDLETKKQKVLNGGAPADGVRVCMYCNVVCNSQFVYDSHIAGKKHVAMVNKQQQ